MKQTMSIALAAGLVWAAAGCKSTATTQETASKSYPMTTCLVADEALDANAVSVVHNGQEVKFCCKDCVETFQKDPDKYLSKLTAK
jgi:YHS domain-containing protein